LVLFEDHLFSCGNYSDSPYSRYGLFEAQEPKKMRKFMVGGISNGPSALGKQRGESSLPRADALGWYISPLQGWKCADKKTGFRS
jgi:hypothetical protein